MRSNLFIKSPVKAMKVHKKIKKINSNNEQENTGKAYHTPHDRTYTIKEKGQFLQFNCLDKCLTGHGSSSKTHLPGKGENICNLTLLHS